MWKEFIQNIKVKIIRIISERKNNSCDMYANSLEFFIKTKLFTTIEFLVSRLISLEEENRELRNRHKIPIKENNGLEFFNKELHKINEKLTVTNKELFENERRFRMLTENVKDAIFKMEIPNEKIEYVSSSVQNIFGYTTENFYKIPYLIRKLIHPDYYYIFEKEQKKIKQGEISKNIEYKIFTSEKKEKWISQKSYLIKDESGKPIFVEGVISDITERKEYEISLEEKNREISQKNEKLQYFNQQLSEAYKELKIKNIEINNQNEELTESNLRIEEINLLLSKSEKKYRLLFDKMNSGFALHKMIYDENNNAIDYQFIEINPAFEEFTGLKNYNLKGKTVLEILPNIEKHWIDTYKKVVKTKQAVKYENYSEELGRYYDVIAYSPQQDYFATIFNDVTKRKEAEIALKQEILVSQIIADISKVGLTINISLHEIAEKVLNVISDLINPIFCFTLFKDVDDSLIMKRIGTCNSCPEKIKKHLNISIINEKELWEYLDVENKEIYFSEKDEGYVFIYPAKAKMQLFGSIGVVSKNPINKDIIERMATIFALVLYRIKTDLELIKAKEKAEESDRLKTTFLANMSHEIRTPMNGIIGFASLLENDNLSKEKRREYIKIIDKSGNLLLTLITDIIDFAKIEAEQLCVQINNCNLNFMLREIYTVFDIERIEKKKNDIKFSLKTDLLDNKSEIFTDENRLRQIINNLLNNAFKFTEKGFVELGYYRKKEFLEFFVKDSGIGIYDEYQEVIFSRFRQEDENKNRNYGGTGLGLSISKGLVELLGGEIWVESEKGKGSSFFFTIPYTTKEINKYIFEQEKEENNFVWENKTILIGDVSEQFFKYLKEIFLVKNINCFYASNSIEIIQKLEEQKDIDLILIDMEFLNEENYEICKTFVEVYPKIPIFVQTNFYSISDREKTIAAGCENYFHKNIDKEELFSILDSYLSD